MKIVSWIGIGVLLVLVAIGFGGRAVAVSTSDGWQANRFIAHAMGGIDGVRYTNSYEAFQASYDRGYRLFEVDLILTKDGKLAARHDWTDDYQPGLPDRNGGASTLSQFKGSLIYGKYEPLSVRDIVRLMRENPDFYLITDTKETKVEKVKKQFEYLVNEVQSADASLLRRIIPEIYSPEMYDAVMEIYPFPNKIYSTYQSYESAAAIIEFVKDKGFSAVAMPVSRVLLDPFLVIRLNKIGLKSYVHSLNNSAFMMLLNRSVGVYGFYTDLETGPKQLSSEMEILHESFELQLWICIFLIGLGKIISGVKKDSAMKIFKVDK
ncbi:phosphatidylinositol-specific phospholipase C/glycerophosphodiester phosphodiesterase family protein [Cohnella mopanensis]|uniref:phosphatidylinositol-specific phospholipase C/glycerophosphodiester phosphodiesterase family protein n=1 Tax=Cohnella mopanensis TaxID=2911966 RepID=UPI001EF94C2D|nr:phosphatidylinositol-specific phospholipase C/glycerophosphodiester phosphodiesterase family protein [Cohnella mopanensis]